MTARNAIFATMLVVALGAVFYEANRASVSSDKAQAQQQLKLAQEIEELGREREHAIRELSVLRDENQRLRESPADLLKLRAELTRLRRDSQERAQLRAAGTDDETDAIASSRVAAVKKLKQRLEETPKAKIPELQFLEASDWLDLAATANLDSEAGYRKALGEVRKRAEGHFTKKFQSALNTYIGEHNGQWPADLTQLKSYFDPPVEDAILQRWEIVPKTAFPGREFASDWVLTEKSSSSVDPEFDHRWTIDGPFSGGVAGPPTTR
jgi:hypothetical protein